MSLEVPRNYASAFGDLENGDYSLPAMCTRPLVLRNLLCTGPSGPDANPLSLQLHHACMPLRAGSSDRACIQNQHNSVHKPALRPRTCLPLAWCGLRTLLEDVEQLSWRTFCCASDPKVYEFTRSSLGTTLVEQSKVSFHGIDKKAGNLDF